MALKEGQKLTTGGFVKNITEFGYDVIDKNGKLIYHITIGRVDCELGVCEHKEHQKD